MKIEKYEKLFVLVCFGLILVAAGAVVWATAVSGAHLPGPKGRIDPNKVHTTAPFDQPGLRQIGEGEYEAVMIASAWQWQPAQMDIPEGAKVHFVITSLDVVHGFRIPDTNANAMIIPGQITEVDVEFKDTGLYSVICHEYCGIGHQNMGGRINVG
jgi:cytochrome c oxidase subunit 2